MPATRSGRAAARFSATAPPNECPTTTTGPAASASSSAASAATLASIVHGASQDDRPWPSRSGATMRELGQVPVGQCLPARRPCPVSPWMARIPGGPGRAVSGRRAAASGHARRCCQALRAEADLSDPRGVIRPCPRHAPRPVARRADRARSARHRAAARRSGHGQDRSCSIETAAARIAAGCRSGIRSAADGFGAARRAGQGRGHRRAAGRHHGSRAAVREPLVRTVHSYAFAVLRLGRPAQRGSAAAADHQRRAGRHHPRAARRRPRGRRRRVGRLARHAAAGAAAPSGSPPSCATCWPAAPSAGWIRLSCNASAGGPAARSGWPRAGSPRSTSR